MEIIEIGSKDNGEKSVKPVSSWFFERMHKFGALLAPRTKRDANCHYQEWRGDVTTNLTEVIRVIRKQVHSFMPAHWAAQGRWEDLAQTAETVKKGEISVGLKQVTKLKQNKAKGQIALLVNAPKRLQKK